MKYSDEKLVAQYLQGNKQAFSFLIIKYNKLLFNYIYRSLQNREISEDLVQETFIRVIKNITRFHEDKLFRPWIYTIATNLVRNELRNKKRRKEVFHSSTVISTAQNQIEKMVIKEDLEKLHHCLQLLSSNNREIFLLRFYDKLSFEEIAEIVNCKTTTARTRMFYALKKLRQFLDK